MTDSPSLSVAISGLMRWMRISLLSRSIITTLHFAVSKFRSCRFLTTGVSFFRITCRHHDLVVPASGFSPWVQVLHFLSDILTSNPAFSRFHRLHLDIFISVWCKRCSSCFHNDQHSLPFTVRCFYTVCLLSFTDTVNIYRYIIDPSNLASVYCPSTNILSTHSTSMRYCTNVLESVCSGHHSSHFTTLC